MSYEYSTSLELEDKFSLAELLQHSHLEELAIVLSVSEYDARLRWTDSAVKAEWPEDIVIVRNTQSLYVLFHIGNKKKFTFLLVKLSSALDRLLNRSIKFTEV